MARSPGATLSGESAHPGVSWSLTFTLTRVTTPTEVLDRAVGRDPARPRLTWYDDLTGERVELSGATLANWVNKTANLLIDELGVIPGVSVSIDLPRHWLLAVWWLAVDAVGALPEVGPYNTAQHDPLVAVIGPDAVSSPPAADEVVAVSLMPLGAPFNGPLPPLVRDYAVDVRGQADHFAVRAAGDHVAGERATALAKGWSLASEDRLIVYSDKTDLVRDLLAPLAADASVVWIRNLAVEKFVERMAAERVTKGLGTLPVGSAPTPSIRWLP